MFLDVSFFNDKRTIDDILPYSFFVDDGVILHKNGCLHSVIQYTGKDLDSLDPTVVSLINDKINTLLMRFPENYNIYIDILREKIEYYPSPSSFSHTSSLLFETERKYFFTKYNDYYDNIFYINIIYKPDIVGELLFNKLVNNSNDIRNIINEFKNNVNDIFAQFSYFFNASILNSNDILSYIYYVSSFSYKNFFYNYSKDDLFFINTIFDFNINYDKNNKYLIVNDFYVKYLNLFYLPNYTYDSMFRSLLSLNIDFRMIARYELLNNEDLTKVLNKYASYYTGKMKTFGQLLMEMATKESVKRVNTGYAALAEDANVALSEATTNISRFGYLSVFIVVYDKDIEVLNKKIDIIKKNSVDFIFNNDSFHYMSLYSSSLPGNLYGNKRKYLVSTKNIVDILPLFTPYRGFMYNNITNTPIPHVICSTPSNTVFFLNTCVGDVGHTLIIGPSGAGKSVLLLTLTISWLKYKNARVFYFDKDRSSRLLCFACEGTFYDDHDIKNIRLQPLRYLDNSDDLLYAQQFIELLLSLQNVTITSDITLIINETLKLMSNKSLETRILSTFVQYCNNSEIKSALQVYTRNGVYGDIFDNSFESGINFSSFTVFEMNGLMSMGKSVLIPYLYHIFHILDKMFKSCVPTLLILDESWLFFDNPYMAQKIKDWLKTLRKFKVSVIFATQELSDIKNSTISSTVISQTVTKIFLPDEQALLPFNYHLYEEIGLSDIEIRLIASAVRKRDYFIKNSLGNRMFNLSLGKLAISLIAIDSGKDHAFLDSIKDNPNKLEAILQYKGVYELYKETLRLLEYDNINTIESIIK